MFFLAIDPDPAADKEDNRSDSWKNNQGRNLMHAGDFAAMTDPVGLRAPEPGSIRKEWTSWLDWF
jgi:hypothetical protein